MSEWTQREVKYFVKSQTQQFGKQKIWKNKIKYKQEGVNSESIVPQWWRVLNMTRSHQSVPWINHTERGRAQPVVHLHLRCLERLDNKSSWQSLASSSSCKMCFSESKSDTITPFHSALQENSFSISPVNLKPRMVASWIIFPMSLCFTLRV